MKVEKFKVLHYLKRCGLDKSGKASIMGCITVKNDVQFSSKLSRSSELWNPIVKKILMCISQGTIVDSCRGGYSPPCVRCSPGVCFFGINDLIKLILHSMQ